MALTIDAQVTVEVADIRLSTADQTVTMVVRKTLEGFGEMKSVVVLRDAEFSAFAKANVDLLANLKAAGEVWLESSAEVPAGVRKEAVTPDTSVVDAIVQVEVGKALEAAKAAETAVLEQPAVLVKEVAP